MTEEKITPILGGNPKYTWDDTVAAIGKDFSGGNEILADEVIEYSSVVRLCEPWEISSPIYWSEQAAKQLGYRGVVVPWSGLRSTFSSKRQWKPGEESRFPSPDPDSSGRSSGPSFWPAGEELPVPPYHHNLVAETEMEFWEPAYVGDRLTVRGDKLVNVRPRQTRVGVGAFVTRERRVYNQRGELVATIRATNYNYNRV